MIEVTMSIKSDKGESKTYLFTQTAEAVKNKKGKVSLAHFQPEPDNPIIKGFSKVYVDTEALSKQKKT